MQATAIELAEVIGDVSARSRRDASRPQEPGALVQARQRDCGSTPPPGFAVRPSKLHRSASFGKSCHHPDCANRVDLVILSSSDSSRTILILWTFRRMTTFVSK